jgi:succinylglutamic semialdehyde dehydrogenase
MISTIRIGAYTDDPEPFMGPVISDAAAEKLLASQQDLIARGGKSMIEMRSTGWRRAMLSPGLIDVTAITDRPDEEIFGPLLQLIRVADFDAALVEANRTAYGLAAGLLSDRADLYEKFRHEIRAGVVNFNRPTTGASGSLPFGGVGLSGNHRPSGYYAADYCSYPIASMETKTLSIPQKLPPGITP